MSTPSKSSPKLWQEAFDLLSAEKRTGLDLFPSNPPALLDDVLSSVKEKQRKCMDSRFKFTIRRGEQIIIRDLFEKATKWIQKFKEVGDAAVQYDTTGASLPWAAVRLVLQISINDVETFRAVAEGIELATRSISRCAVYEALYLDAQLGMDTTDLRKQLVILYSAILSFLAKAAAYYARGSAMRIMGSARNSTGGTKEAMDEVLHREKEVERVSRLLHDQDDQQKQYAILRKLLQSIEGTYMISADTLTQVPSNLVSDERRAVLMWLSTANHRLQHEKIYHDVVPGTGQWISLRKEYQDWQSSRFSSLLWVHGIPGCGKTKLISTIVQTELEAIHRDPSLAPVAYFYYSRNTAPPEGRSSDAAIRDILKQLAFREKNVQIHPSVRDEFRKWKTEASREGVEMLAPTVEDCLQMLRRVLEECPATIFVDGLDEIDDDPGSLLSALKTVVEETSGRTRVLFSSRNDSSISAHLSDIPRIEITSAENSGDIALFVNTSLDLAIQQRRILQGNVSAELRGLISKTLCNGASSMFLWASLHIKQLCDQQRFKLEIDIIDALDSLPASLKSLFGQICSRIEKYPDRAKRNAERTIAWILVAERPLTTSELLSSSSYGQDVYPDQNLSASDIFNLCSGLIVQDTISEIVTFAHSSIREYLQELPQYSIFRLNNLAARDCIKCLLDGSEAIDLSDSGSVSSGGPTFHNYSTLYWARHFARAETSDRTETLKKLLSAFIIEDEGQNFQFWIEDVQVLLQDGILDPSLFSELNACISKEACPVFVASVYGIREILDVLASASPGISYNVKNKFDASPIYVGARYGHAEVVEKLIKLGAQINIVGGYLGTALQAAAYGGHDSTVRRLLDSGADPYQKGKFDSAIHAAMIGAQESTIILLLSKVSGSSTEYLETWLSMAAYGGHHDVVEMLLENIKERQMQDSTTPPTKYPHDALQSALYRGRMRVAARLLKCFINVNSSGGHFGNALQAACMGGNYDLVKMLLDMGADPDAAGTYGSPLKACSLSGKNQIIELLISRGASLTPNALEGAASGGHLSTLQLLLSHIPSENTASRKGDTSQSQFWLGNSLCAASRGGYCDIVKLLLEKGAKPFASRALEDALSNHKHDVARILFDSIPEIEDYTRFAIILSSVGARDAWLNEDFEKELNTMHTSHYKTGSKFKKGPREFLTKMFHDRESSVIKQLRPPHLPNLGGGNPNGKEFLERLTAITGSADDFSALLERGVQLNGYSHPAPVEIAAKVGNLEVLGLLLDRGADLKGALQAATYCGQTEAFCLIFEKRPATDPDSIPRKEVEKYYRTIQHQSALSLAIENVYEEKSEHIRDFTTGDSLSPSRLLDFFPEGSGTEDGTSDNLFGKSARMINDPPESTKNSSKESEEGIVREIEGAITEGSVKKSRDSKDGDLEPSVDGSVDEIDSSWDSSGNEIEDDESVLGLEDHGKYDDGEGSEEREGYESENSKTQDPRTTDMSMVILLLDYKSKSANPGPGPSLLEALKRSDKRIFDLVLSSTCEVRERAWTDKERDAISDAVKFAIQNDDFISLQKILDTTDALAYDRQWILDSMVDAAAVSSNERVLDYVHDLASPVETEKLAGTILLAYAKDNPKTIWNHEKILGRHVTPFIGCKSFQYSFQSVFYALIHVQAYKEAIELLKRYSDHFQALVTARGGIICSIMPSMEDAWRVSTDDIQKLATLLIERGASVNERDERSNTPLYYACTRGWNDMFFFLLEAGADMTVLHGYNSTYEDEGEEDANVNEDKFDSTQHECVNLLELTLGMIAKKAPTRMQASEYKQWSGIIFKMLEAGLVCEFGDPGLRTIFECACYLGFVTDIEKLLDPSTWKSFPSLPPQHFLVENSSGIHVAAYGANKEAVAALINHGAHLSIKRPDPDSRSKLVTPLEAALSGSYFGRSRNFWQMIYLMIDHGIPDTDYEALLNKCIEYNHHPPARRFLEQRVRVTNLPESIRFESISLLLEDRFRDLVPVDDLPSVLASYIKGEPGYEKIKQILDAFHSTKIAYPSPGTLFHAIFDNGSLSASEIISLLDIIMLRCNHSISDTFECPDCGHSINLLSYTLKTYYLRGQDVILQALLDRGADTDCPGLPFPALTLVCRFERMAGERRLKMAEMLLNYGSNVNGIRMVDSSTKPQPTSPTQLDAPEQTPLMYAVTIKHLKLTSLLIERGAEVNLGFIAPLRIALRANPKSSKMIDFLTEKGGEVRPHDQKREVGLDPAFRPGVSYFEELRCWTCDIYKPDFGLG